MCVSSKAVEKNFLTHSIIKIQMHGMFAIIGDNMSNNQQIQIDFVFQTLDLKYV